MKKYLFGVLFIAFAMVGCEKGSTNGYAGTYDARLVGGVGTQINCEMIITQSGNEYQVKVTDGGNSITRDIVVDVVDNGGEYLDVVTCNDNCYQGDGDITGGQMYKVEGKIVLDFEVDDWIGITVSEL